MFIVSIPIATHKVPLDVGVGERTASALSHRIDLDPAGRLFWDGRAISDAQLPSILASHAADPSDPELHIAAAAETRYERVDQLLAAILRAGITRTGFVGNDRFAEMMD
jgi:biopolymer transport protein ExbD